MTTTTSTEAAPATMSLWQRLSDRCNPILVRELQQSLRSRALTGALLLALLTLFGLSSTLGVMSAFDSDREHGREAFMASFGALVPFLTLLLPMQAFFSMMHEVRDGSAELLTMSRLTPRQIVRGKLQAAGVLFLLFLALFAPTMALTWLLRGISITLILLTCGFALLLALASSSLAIAVGALARSRQVTPMTIAVTTMGLGGITIGAIGSGVQLIETLERSPVSETLRILGTIALGLLAALWLCALVAQSQLTHPVENRATPFRIYFVALAAVVFAWVLGITSRTEWPMATAVAGMGFQIAFALPAMIMATEENGLSPRVRRQVPARAPLLAAPWLPGGRLGLIYVILLEGLVLGVVWLAQLCDPVPAASRPYYFADQVQFAACTGALYVIVHAALAARIRAWLGPGVAKSWLARSITVALFGVLMLAPLTIEAIAGHRLSRWTPLHVMNPFWTIAELMRQKDQHATLYLILGGMATCLVLLQARGILSSLREVVAARRS